MSTSCIVSYTSQVHARGCGVPQSIYATIVAFQLIDDIQTLHPLSVAVDASNVRVLFAMLPKLALEQAVVNCVFHACVSAARRESWKISCAGRRYRRGERSSGNHWK
jgi:hypothetical protein